MAAVKVFPSQLKGSLKIPPSKSQTLRALIFASLANGKSHIKNPLPSPDTMQMIAALRSFGVPIDMDENTLIIEGKYGKFEPAEDVIHCGNSGQVLRFIGALAALTSSYTILSGDLSIRHNRPVSPLLDGLNQLGAFAVSSRLDGFAPIIIKGPVKGKKVHIDGADSQPVSALLILGTQKPLEITVDNAGEKPWLDLTLSWLDRLKVKYQNDDYRYFKTQGHSEIKHFNYSVPGDFSSAAFPIGAALLTGSEIELKNLDFHDVQGDKKLISTLEEMGASFEKTKESLNIQTKNTLSGKKIDVNDMIDALPILSVIACFANSPTEIIGAEIARRKESDRISTIAQELTKMGAKIEEKKGGLVIHPSKLKGAKDLDAHADHRIAMSLIVAAMAAEGPSTVHGVECIAKSYPSFFTDLTNLGAKIFSQGL